VSASLFFNNISNGQGGAITGGPYGFLDVTDSSFVENYGSQGGGIYYYSPVRLAITNTTFSGNYSYYPEGGKCIYMHTARLRRSY
jgi:hypothetical protein